MSEEEKEPKQEETETKKESEKQEQKQEQDNNRKISQVACANCESMILQLVHVQRKDNILHLLCLSCGLSQFLSLQKSQKPKPNSENTRTPLSKTRPDINYFG